MIHYSLTESDPNLEVSVRIFLTIPVKIALCERNFSKLKLMKNDLRSSLNQEKLLNTRILSIENKICKDFDIIIDNFPSIKTQKILL